MPKIAAVATAVPPHRVTQAEARAFAADFFRPHRRDIDRLLNAFDHTGIATRYLTQPMDWFRTSRSFPEKNELYIEWSTRLGARVIADCVRESGIAALDIDHLIFVSTTGLATPSIDSRLLNVCGLSPHVTRTPVWGLGCAGGAAGLALAGRLARADTAARVMLVAVELCGLTFHSDDFSKSNVIAMALFGDGAAGVLVVGDDVSCNGAAIVDSASTTWPDSLDVMGWNFDSVGMQVVFSRAIPDIVRTKAHDNVSGFLARTEHRIEDVSHWIIHPGGAKVIAAYEEALPLPDGAMDHARSVLHDYGNMSSPTVLFALKRFLAEGSAQPGDYAVLSALGPGFSAENVLLHL